MKIVQIGGTFVAAQKEIEEAIHKYIVCKGEDSYILYSIGQSDDPHIIKCETKVESFFRRGLNKIFGKKTFHAVLQTLHVIHFLKKIKPDIIHLHILHNGYYHYPFLLKYAIKNKIPVVYTMHDFWAITGGCYYFTTNGCNKYKDGCMACLEDPKLLDCSRRLTEKHYKQKKELLSKIDPLAVVAVSEWVNTELDNSFLSKCYRKVIWNSIKTPQYEHQKVFDTNMSKFKILGVATWWSERKGIHRFFELAEKLGGDFEIILVGDVNKAYLEMAPKNITFMGLINNKSLLYSLYAECDLNISLSYEETFGMTFIESAMVGTRSIGFNSTAVPQVLKKVHGIVADSLDEIVKTVRYLDQNREKCKLSVKEISEITSFFSNERMSSEYYELYKSILSGKEF
ncbi:MAG: glycosyltransferase [Acutalibacter sp.]|nr:glycosyltransferase [Clostridiales bacterium]MCI9553490.1 glycosyltransferase [Acutalibacter sp.]